MSFTLRQLRAFLSVAETRNFTTAARTLNLTQPVVSGLVHQLEESLGFRLFDRTTRRVELTPTAAEFLLEARAAVSDLDRAIAHARDVGGRRRGRINVGAPPLLAAALLPDVIRDFAAAFPGIVVNVVDASIAQLVERLREGRLHLALGTFREDEVGVIRTRLISDPLSLICPVEHPIAAIAEPTWRDLEGVPIVAMAQGNGIREQINRGFALAGVKPTIANEFEQMSTVLAFAAKGFGPTILPLYALSAFAIGSCTVRPLVAPVVTREVAAIHRDGHSLSAATAQFVRQLQITANQLQADGERRVLAQDERSRKRRAAPPR